MLHFELERGKIKKLEKGEKNMKTTIIAYLASFLTMAFVDGIWLSLTAKSFYAKNMGPLMNATPYWVPAVLFYLLFPIGLTFLVILPVMKGGGSLVQAGLLGALLGLVSYGTYDLTNQATIREWPFVVTVVDLIWGTSVSAVVSMVALKIVMKFG